MKVYDCEVKVSPSYSTAIDAFESRTSESGVSNAPFAFQVLFLSMDNKVVKLTTSTPVNPFAKFVKFGNDVYRFLLLKVNFAKV